MSYTEGGHCAKCGAPYHYEMFSHSILPPKPIPTCGCWNVPQTITTTDTGSVPSHKMQFLGTGLLHGKQEGKE